MKRLTIPLTVILVVAFIGFASAQPYWPDPCDQNVISAEYSTFAGRFPNDGVIRFPALISYMGYFDQDGLWHWWTTETYPGCLFHPHPDDLPGYIFYDPETGGGSAWLPHAVYGDPSGVTHQRYYHSFSDPFPYQPWIGITFDTAVQSPWGWLIRKSILETGAENWKLSFSLSKTVYQPQCWWQPNIDLVDNKPPTDSSWNDNAVWEIVCTSIQAPGNPILMAPVAQIGQPITWQDIEDVKIRKKVGADYEDQRFRLTGRTEEYYRIVLANFDPQRSWLNTTCTSDMPPFSCDLYDHECIATITGIEPKTGETYALIVTLKDGTILQSPDWIVPVTMELEPVPKVAKKTITNVNGKITTTGSTVPAIQLTEREDGSLLVQYIAPFIKAEPPPLQIGVYMPNAWRGTAIRFGLANKPADQLNDPENPAVLLWPNIPSNVDTVIFPKEFINRLKNSPRFTGTSYIIIQHRDQLNIKRWITGEGFIPYQFKNPYPVP